MSNLEDDENKSLRQYIREDDLWRALSIPSKADGTTNYYVTFDNKRKRNACKIRMRNHILIQHLLRHRGAGFIRNICITNLRLFGGMSRWKMWGR